MKPGAGSNDYEVSFPSSFKRIPVAETQNKVWTDEPSWATLASQSSATRKLGGEFGWNEVDGNT
jgi:hypothetical protein